MKDADSKLESELNCYTANPLDFSNNNLYYFIASYVNHEDSHGSLIIKKGNVITNISSDHNIGHYVDMSNRLRDEYQDYIEREGRSYIKYLVSKGNKLTKLVGGGITNIGKHAVAGLATDKDESLLLSDENFYQKVSNLAMAYRLSFDEALDYVFSHETTHRVKSLGNYARSIIGDTAGLERKVEETLYEYFIGRADSSSGKSKEKYLRLAKVAKDREGKAEKFYGNKDYIGKECLIDDAEEQEKIEQNLEECIEEENNEPAEECSDACEEGG